MNISVDKNVLNSLLDEKQFNKEFKAMLNELIDDELKKEFAADVVMNNVSTSESNCEFIRAI